MAPETELLTLGEKRTFVAQHGPSPGVLRPIQCQESPALGRSGATLSLPQGKEEPLLRSGGEPGRVPTLKPRVCGVGGDPGDVGH